jgi:transposase InsO family protein
MMGRMASHPWKTAAHAILTTLASWLHFEQEAAIAYQKEEIRTLREMLGGKPLRFTDAQRRRLALKARSLSHAALGDLGSIVTPDTLTRWFRKYAGTKYDGHAKRTPGRPPKPQQIRDLVVRLAQENAAWGYTRIRDVMRHLGHEIGRTTVQRILDEDGIEPAPERRKHMPWSTFLNAHWGAIAAMDFLKVEVLSLRGPVRYAVLVAMDLQSRRVNIAGILPEPYEDWTLQVLRNLIDGVDGFLVSHRSLIMDRDPVFTQEFRARLVRAGIEPIRLPSRSPNLNAFVERFNRSIKEECLDRVIPLGEAHLRELVREYVAHYHEERPHQGLNGERVAASTKLCSRGPVARRERLGGLLNHYYREAA